MRVMGIDPSTKTGIVTLPEGAPLGLEHLLIKKVDCGDRVGLRRLHLIATHVAAELDYAKPTHVFIEGLAFGNKFTLVMLAQIQALIRLEVYHRKIPMWEVNPTTLKRWVTGKGSATKTDIATAVKARWGFQHESDDVVDGYALAQLGLEVLGTGSGIKGVSQIKE